VRGRIVLGKATKKDVFYNLGKYPNMSVLRGLIALIDGYLAYFFDDPDPYDRAIKQGALGKEFANEWKEIYKTLYKIAYTLKRVPEIRKYIVAQGAFRSFSLPLTLTGALLAIFSMFPDVPVHPILLLIAAFMLATTGAIALILSWIAGKKVADAVDSYFKEHREKYKFKRAYLKSVVQKLLYSLAYYLKKDGVDLNKFKFKMFNSFYKGIIVLKRPKLFRKKYLVRFNVKQLPF